jgi:hypothetical protein
VVRVATLGTNPAAAVTSGRARMPAPTVVPAMSNAAPATVPGSCLSVLGLRFENSRCCCCSGSAGVGTAGRLPADCCCASRGAFCAEHGGRTVWRGRLGRATRAANLLLLLVVAARHPQDCCRRILLLTMWSQPKTGRRPADSITSTAPLRGRERSGTDDVCITLSQAASTPCNTLHALYSHLYLQPERVTPEAPDQPQGVPKQQCWLCKHADDKT